MKKYLKACNYSDLIEQFGAPSSIISSYYENLDEEQEGLLLKKTQFGKTDLLFLGSFYLCGNYCFEF